MSKIIEVEIYCGGDCNDRYRRMKFYSEVISLRCEGSYPSVSTLSIKRRGGSDSKKLFKF